MKKLTRIALLVLLAATFYGCGSSTYGGGTMSVYHGGYYGRSPFYGPSSYYGGGVVVVPPPSIGGGGFDGPVAAPMPDFGPPMMGDFGGF